LSRAYSSGVKKALDELLTEPKIDRMPVEIVIAYENVTELQRLLTEMEVVLRGEEYGERVRFQCAVPTLAFEALSAAVADATNGSGSVLKR
jgi:putative IMPACT (imprinted ancient) family translation regulator